MFSMDELNKRALRMYDLEEGEIIEEEDEISILESYNNSFYNCFQDSSTYPLNSHHKKLQSHRESRYPSNYFSSRHPPHEVEYPSHPYSKFRRKKSGTEKKYASSPSKKYVSSAIRHESAGKFHEKSKTSSSSSNLSSCSCSSCSGCSSETGSPVSSPTPIHPKDGYHHSKASHKTSEERKELNHQRVGSKPDKRVESSSHSPPKAVSQRKKSSDSRSLQDKNSKSNSHRERRHKPSSELKSSKSRSTEEVKSSKSAPSTRISLSQFLFGTSPRLEDVSTDSGSNDSGASSLSREKSSTRSKLIPGSLGEMLLKKQLKGKLRKESVASSPTKKSLASKKENGDKDYSSNHSSKENSKCEIVDLCQEEDDDDDDELTLRIKALESAMRSRPLNPSLEASAITTVSSSLLESWNDSAFKPFKLSGKKICSDRIHALKSESENESEHDSKDDDAHESESNELTRENEPDVNINDDSEDFVRKKLEENTLNNNNINLDDYIIDSELDDDIHKIKLDDELIEKDINYINSKNEFYVDTCGSEVPVSDINKSEAAGKDKCEITSVDMDISNDSFSDFVAAAGSDEIITGEKNGTTMNGDQERSKQDLNFSIPIEWAYMMPPPPHPDQPDNNLNSISNWCFNQNMYVQSMQDSVNETSSQSSWKLMEIDQTSEAFNTPYCYPPSQTVGESVHCDDDLKSNHNDYFDNKIKESVDSSALTGELRDSHAEQYKSFMSTVITQNQCQSLVSKKDQHRDLVNIQLEPSAKYQNLKYAPVKPERKANAPKRRGRRRRRSSRKSGSGEMGITSLLEEGETPSEIDAGTKIVVDEEDEDMLRALLLNDMTLKNKNKVQGLHSRLGIPKQERNSNKMYANIISKGQNKINILSSKAKPILKSTLPRKDHYRKPPGYNKEKKNKWLTERKLSNVTIVKQITSDTNKDATLLRGFSLSKFPPVKPVIISITNDSDSDAAAQEETHQETFRNCDSVISGIDSLIRSCRNKQSLISQENKQEGPTPRVPLLQTPKGMMHLSKEKQLEYRQLKQLIISKKEALLIKNRRKLDAKNILHKSHEGKENVLSIVHVVQDVKNKIVDEFYQSITQVSQDKVDDEDCQSIIQVPQDKGKVDDEACQAITQVPQDKVDDEGCQLITQVLQDKDKVDAEYCKSITKVPQDKINDEGCQSITQVSQDKVDDEDCRSIIQVPQDKGKIDDEACQSITQVPQDKVDDEGCRLITQILQDKDKVDDEDCQQLSCVDEQNEVMNNEERNCSEGETVQEPLRNDSEILNVENVLEAKLPPTVKEEVEQEHEEISVDLEPNEEPLLPKKDEIYDVNTDRKITSTDLSKAFDENTQSFVTELVSEIDTSENIPQDASEDSSSSGSESSSSSSEDSESASEDDETEINLRNKLLQRRELLLKKENHLASLGKDESGSKIPSEKLEHTDRNCDNNSGELLSESFSPVGGTESETKDPVQDLYDVPSNSQVILDSSTTDSCKTLQLDNLILNEFDTENQSHVNILCTEGKETEEGLDVYPNNDGKMEIASTSDYYLCSLLQDSKLASQKEQPSQQLATVSEINTADKHEETSRTGFTPIDCKIDSEPPLSDFIHTTKSEIHSKSKMLDIASLNKSPKPIVSKDQSDRSKDWKLQETQAQKIMTQTFKKVQEELNSRLMSVKMLNSQISQLFTEAMTEEFKCHNSFTEIISLLSQINTLRKERKEKTALISLNYTQVNTLLQKLNADMNYLSRLETLVQKHYNVKEAPLLLTISKNKVEGEAQRKRCNFEVKKLRETVEVLNSQEIILSKTFSKPLGNDSQRRGAVIPPRMALKKKQFKLDNRVFKRQLWNPRENKPRFGDPRESKSKTSASDKSKISASDIVPSGNLSSGVKLATFVSKRIPSPEKKVTEHHENDKLSGDLVLCPYDLLGRCNDDQCIYQHMSAAVGQVRSPLHSSSKSSVSSSNKMVNISIPVIDKSKNPQKLNVDSEQSRSCEKESCSERGNEMPADSSEENKTSLPTQEFHIEIQQTTAAADVPKEPSQQTIDVSQNIVQDNIDYLNQKNCDNETTENSDHLEANRKRCKRKSWNRLTEMLKRRKVGNVSLIPLSVDCEPGKIDLVEKDVSALDVRTSDVIEVCENLAGDVIESLDDMNTSCCEELSDVAPKESDVTQTPSSTSKTKIKHQKARICRKEPPSQKLRRNDGNPALYVRVLRSSKRGEKRKRQ